MADNQLMISEEYIDDEPTGFEVETRDGPEGDSPRSEQPWDPRKIRVAPRSYSLRNIIDFVDEETLELFPEFQRNKVWGPQQRSRLIESVLLQIPLPAFYFVEDRDLGMKVVDGVQRLSSVCDFVRGEYPLVHLEYLKELDGRRFAELGVAAQRRIYSSQISVNVVDPTTPEDVKFNIYKRINTGGAPLTDQEIRHCMSRQRSRDFLKKLTELDEFQNAVNGTKLAVRMADRELVLRFCAFAHFKFETYHKHANIEMFLNRMSDALGDPAMISDADLDRLREEFTQALRNCDTVFGAHSFRKWPLTQKQAPLNPFNRTLFETWCYALRGEDAEAVRHQKTDIARKARDLMTGDQAYIQAITTATGDPKKLEYRFKAALRVVAEALGSGEDLR